VSAGCSSADDLVALFEDRIDEVETACGRADFVELHHNELIIRGSWHAPTRPAIGAVTMIGRGR
jgi:hypothetical protein